LELPNRPLFGFGQNNNVEVGKMAVFSSVLIDLVF
jgi:hypothetical protein